MARLSLGGARLRQYTPGSAALRSIFPPPSFASLRLASAFPSPARAARVKSPTPSTRPGGAPGEIPRFLLAPAGGCAQVNHEEAIA